MIKGSLKIKKKFKYIYFLFFLIFVSKDLIGLENKIIFKINNKAFTTIDFEMRIRYLDFVGNNEEISREIIMNDFISANLFYEYFIKSNSNKNYEERINEIFENIKNVNINNNKVYKYELNKENILFNIKIDYIRKSILEDLLNSNIDNFNVSKKEIDLLYNFKITYINLSIEDFKILDREIKNLNLEELIKLLNKKNIDYFIKEKEIHNINNIDKRIKNNILTKNNSFIIKDDKSFSYIYVDKKFETQEGIILDLYSVKSNNLIETKKLQCNKLKNKSNNLNILNKEYNFIELNNDLKNNLLDINDLIRFETNNEYIYVILCNIKFDKEILNNYDFNKMINSNVSVIESKFIKKYSKVYKLEKINE